MYVPNYGSIKKITTLADGTEKTVETNYSDGKPGSNRITYTKRVKVNDESQELAEYISFRKMTKGYIDVDFKVQHVKGTHYVIMTWTEKI